MDAGPVLAQLSLPVEGEDTTGKLMKTLARLGAPLYLETVAERVAGRVTPATQAHAVDVDAGPDQDRRLDQVAVQALDKSAPLTYNVYRGQVMIT